MSLLASVDGEVTIDSPPLAMTPNLLLPTLQWCFSLVSGPPRHTRLQTSLRRPLTRLPVGDIADIVVPKSTDRAGFLVEAASGAFDGCLVAYRTFGSVSITGRVDSELVVALPPSLRFICHNGAGFDQIVGSSSQPPGLHQARERGY